MPRIITVCLMQKEQPKQLSDTYKTIYARELTTAIIKVAQEMSSCLALNGSLKTRNDTSCDLVKRFRTLVIFE